MPVSHFIDLKVFETVMGVKFIGTTWCYIVLKNVYLHFSYSCLENQHSNPNIRYSFEV